MPSSDNGYLFSRTCTPSSQKHSLCYLLQLQTFTSQSQVLNIAASRINNDKYGKQRRAKVYPDYWRGVSDAINAL